MRGILPILFLAFGAAASAEDFATLSGDTYKGATVTAVDQYRVAISFSDGVATIPLASLPDAVVKRLSPGDRTNDGRFWLERAQALYTGWQKQGAVSGQKLEDAMAPVQKHVEAIAAYVQQQEDAQREARKAALLAMGSKAKAKASPGSAHALTAGDVWKKLNTPGIIESFLQQARER